MLLFSAAVAVFGVGGALLMRWVVPSNAGADPPMWASQVAETAAPSASPGSTGDISPPVGVPVYSMSVKFPRSGPESYTYANTTGRVLGRSGPIRRFRVAIESNLSAITPMADVLAKINSTLGDERSWVGGGTYRLQQVPPTSSYEFTIYLVTSHTSTVLCAPLTTGGYTSCRQGGRVVLNLDRWMTSVPDYVKAKVALDVYRSYMINHEVGHALGHGHELCPGNGKPAPVMEQQTLGLHGCVANPWVYVNGKRYDGPPGVYDPGD